jgi:cell wall-associated NlpC family hydrolase
MTSVLAFVCFGTAFPVRTQVHEPKPEPGSVVPSKVPTGLLDQAKAFLGTPYVWGGNTPRGFDCSGFVRYVFGSFGVNLERSSKYQAQQGRPVSLANAQEGDLLFFKSGRRRAGIGHVGIYLGDGMFIHASATNPSHGRRIGSVKISDLADSHYAKALVAVRRVLVPTDFSPMPKPTGVGM